MTAAGVTPFRTTESDGSADFGATTGTAATLSSLGAGIDRYGRSGIINSMTDVDYFKFTPILAGSYDIMLGRHTPSPIDLFLDIRNSSGRIIASEGGDTTNPDRNVYDQHVTVYLNAGSTYYVTATGQGNYGDMGQYVVRASRLGDATNPWQAEDIRVVVFATWLPLTALTRLPDLERTSDMVQADAILTTRSISD